MGLSIDYFYSLTPAQFFNIQHGYFNKEKRNNTESWMQTKVVCYQIYLTVPRARGKVLGFEKFVNTFFGGPEKLEVPIDIDKEAIKKRASKMFKKIDALKNLN